MSTQLTEATLDQPPGGAAAAVPPTRPRRDLMTPWRLLAVVAACALLAFKSVHSFIDPDVYWHVELGREMLDRRQVKGTGTDWAFTLPDASWNSTQWLSEVVFALAHAWAGWSGIAVLRVALAGATATALALLLLRRRRTPWAAVVYATVLLVVSTAWQERPQLFSLVLLVWLAWHCHAVLRGGSGTRVWAVFLLTVLWANLHGLWVLVPVCLGAAAFARLLDAGRDRPGAEAALRLLVPPAVSLVAACLTPVGPALLLSPFRFAGATEHIDEWQPTSFDEPYTVIFGLLLATLALCWARAGRVGAGEVVYVLGLTAFSLMAVRNVVPVAILLAPVVLDRLEGLWPRRDRVGSAAEGSLLTGVAALIAVVFLAQGLIAWSTTSHVPEHLPVRLVQALAATPGEHRVLNDYAISGAVVHWGGEDLRVAVDGRADRYGSAYISDYQDLLALRGDWEQTLRELGPDSAVLRQDLPIVRELVEHRGWRQAASQGEYVLLLRGA